LKVLLLFVFLSGCAAGEKYYVDTDELARARTLPPEAPVKAKRVKYLVDTQVRAGTLDLAGIEQVDAYKVKVRASAPSKMVFAGHLLTWTGTALSIAGTLLFVLTPTHSPAWLAGVITAASGEPFMISGTVVWILGLKRRPAEIR
jgi:hypothetical protein